MMLVLSLACTLATHDYYLKQLPPIHPSISSFTHPQLLISALSMHLPPVLWDWIRAPATHLLGARILPTLSFPTHPAANMRPVATLAFPLLCSQYLELFQRGPIWMCGTSSRMCDKIELSRGITNQDDEAIG